MNIFQYAPLLFLTIPFVVMGFVITVAVRQSIREDRFRKANPPKALSDEKVEALARHLCEVDAVDPHAKYANTGLPGWMHYIPNARHYIAAHAYLSALDAKHVLDEPPAPPESSKALVTGIKRIQPPPRPPRPLLQQQRGGSGDGGSRN